LWKWLMIGDDIGLCGWIIWDHMGLYGIIWDYMGLYGIMAILSPRNYDHYNCK
jgi:hypothetical protein